MAKGVVATSAKGMVISVVALVLSACGNSEPATDGDGGAAESVTVTAVDLAFDPSSIPATAGTDLTVSVTNEDDVEHSFTAEALDIDVVVAPGATEEVELTVPDGGLPFVCRFHPSMTGTIGDTQSGGGMGGGGTRDDIDY